MSYASPGRAPTAHPPAGQPWPTHPDLCSSRSAPGSPAHGPVATTEALPAGPDTAVPCLVTLTHRGLAGSACHTALLSPTATSRTEWPELPAQWPAHHRHWTCLGRRGRKEARESGRAGGPQERGPGGALTPAEGPVRVRAPEPSVPSLVSLLFPLAQPLRVSSGGQAKPSVPHHPRSWSLLGTERWGDWQRALWLAPQNLKAWRGGLLASLRCLPGRAGKHSAVMKAKAAPEPGGTWASQQAAGKSEALRARPRPSAAPAPPPAASKPRALGHSRGSQNRLCSGCNQQQPHPQYAEAPARALSMVTRRPRRVSLGFKSSVAQPLASGGAES